MISLLIFEAYTLIDLNCFEIITYSKTPDNSFYVTLFKKLFSYFAYIKSTHHSSQHVTNHLSTSHHMFALSKLFSASLNLNRF